MAGLPGMVVPAGVSSTGLPLGLQIIGKAFDEETVLRAGQVIEDAAGPAPAPESWWNTTARTGAAGKAADAGKASARSGGKPAKKAS
jgi:aspartyl-tRNA(Asn)/glutamyl-tRNA(Gln) amidotransferase subunit A